MPMVYVWQEVKEANGPHRSWQILARLNKTRVQATWLILAIVRVPLCRPNEMPLLTGWVQMFSWWSFALINCQEILPNSHCSAFYSKGLHTVRGCLLRPGKGHLLGVTDTSCPSKVHVRCECKNGAEFTTSYWGQSLVDCSKML